MLSVVQQCTLYAHQVEVCACPRVYESVCVCVTGVGSVTVCGRE